ncbi:MAG: nitrogenase component 1 [Clostridiaceae bacterium]|nr:nitrogenase component 1 [Clostridiaceae bacterium]
MKQTARIISTYASDVSGVCSALYELGGMTVMHDASGCNSTYNTHDEPRWYDRDSFVFISALSEMDAILGDDEKLIRDITETALELHPRFIAVAGTPIPMMIGTDFDAVAKAVEENTSIPSFGITTNGMHSYISGAGAALDAITRRFVDPSARPTPGAKRVNLLGATPLDFSINGSVEAIRVLLTSHGWEVVSTWAMGDTLDKLARAGEANVNLVVSYSGIPAARRLRQMFGTPYVTGVPVGEAFSETLLTALEHGECAVPYTARPKGADAVIIGESICSGSLAAAISEEHGLSTRVLCPLETEDAFLAEGDRVAPDEDDLIPLLADAKIVIADPLYRPICPDTAKFYPLPSEGFSGRIYRRDIPNLIGRKLS